MPYQHIAALRRHRADARRQAAADGGEIVPSFNACLYFRVGYTLARAVARLLYRVRIGFADETRLKTISPDSTLVFVIHHRSNMDYVLVSFLAAGRVTLSCAVGEWARVWGLQQLIRAMGAFFVRRNSGDPPYRVVLQRYVQLATEAGVTQAMFPEGGLTIDGRLRTLLSFAGSQLWLMFNGQWHRFGYACVNFGAPVSMRDWCRTQGLHVPTMGDEQRRREVTRVAEHLMAQIGQVVPVLPVSLVAPLFLHDAQRRWSELELKAAMHQRMARLQSHGAHNHIPRQDEDYAFGVGLRMLVQRHLVMHDDGLFALAPGAVDLVAYHANAIDHIGADPSPAEMARAA